MDMNNVVAFHHTEGNLLRLIVCLRSDYNKIVYNSNLDMQVSTFKITSDYELVVTKNDETTCYLPLLEDWLVFITDDTHAAAFMMIVKHNQRSIYKMTDDDNGIISLIQD